MGGDRCGPSTIQGSSKAPGGRLCRQLTPPRHTNKGTLMNTTLTKLATMGAAATAIGAVGFFTVPGLAQAHPMSPLPLAPACDSYGFNGATALSQDNGWAVQFSSTGPN